MGLAIGGGAEEDAAVAVLAGFEIELEVEVAVLAGGAEPAEGLGAGEGDDRTLLDGPFGVADGGPAVEGGTVEQERPAVFLFGGGEGVGLCEEGGGEGQKQKQAHGAIIH
ncbi:MAG: hypothetical protein R2729_25110 [Bryobacteraceae bacterium]